MGKSNRPATVRNTELDRETYKLTPAQQYAGELLSYLLQVVLGKAGNPESRKDWETKGLHEKLDLNYISETMTDPEKTELALMVLDWNILHLAKVLYYYDDRLSLYKGKFSFAEIYPAAEVVAIRLLLLKKMHQGEKINLKALIDLEEALINKDYEFTKIDFDVTNLKADEMALIRDVIQEEPHFYGYLKSPFIIRALFKVGAVSEDAFVQKKVCEANYKDYRCRPFHGSEREKAIRVAILPSMVKAFYHGDAYEGLSQHGFKPTEFFNEIVERLRSKILDRTKTVIHTKLTEGKGSGGQIKGKEWDAPWKGILREKISFYIEDERPLVIYPDNAKEVTQDVCPEADFSIILLDKNVYLSIYFDEQRDVYPHVPWIYIDIMEVEYSRIQEEVDQIAQFICSKLIKDVPEEN